VIGINRVTLLGRAATEPEVKQTKSGKTVANLVIAIPGRNDGEPTVEYFDVVAWDATAEACGKYVTKGMPLYAEGRLRKRVWDGEDGQKRSAYSVSAQRIVFLGSRPPSAESAAGEAVEAEAEETEAEPGL
jgi:single-strand DNA-binding protein